MFEIISEGNVYVTAPGTGKAAGSRTATLPDGRLACTFMMNAKTGANQFVPMIAYSSDGGESWSEAKVLFPDKFMKESIFGSIRNTLDGRICFAGTTTPITSPDQMFWSDELGAMLENKVIFSISEDGVFFPEPTVVDLPYYASAELPGGMLVEEDGALSILYSPYRAIEMREDTDVCQMTILKSRDGKSFTHLNVGKAQAPCQYGEAWLVKLKNGVQVISAWQTARIEGSDQYLLSFDGGETFTEPKLFPFNGQSTAAEPYGEDEVLIIYNQRKTAPVGVWLARAKVVGEELSILANECIWKAEEAAKKNTSGDFDQWTSFAFGEPHVRVLPTGELLATLWYDQNGVQGIRCVKLKITE